MRQGRRQDPRWLVGISLVTKTLQVTVRNSGMVEMAASLVLEKSGLRERGTARISSSRVTPAFRKAARKEPMSAPS